MALFNHAMKELTAKIVYYGPGLCGKTSNLKILHQRLERGAGKLVSLSTAQDRTIYFDLLPIELGNIKGYTVRFQLCTVPGQVFYNETRKIVLRGVDGLVFVVDSQWSMLSHNLECFQNLKENLHAEKVSLETLPVVIQYNKRDLPSALSVEALQDSLGFHSYPYVETVASEGSGVTETFKLVSKLTFVDLLRRLQRGGPPAVETPVEAAPVETTPVEAAPAETVPVELAPALVMAGGARASDQREAPSEASADASPDAPSNALLEEATADMPAANDEPLEVPRQSASERSGDAWVVPSVDGAFPGLSDEEEPFSATAQAAETAAAEPPPPDPILGPGVLLAALTTRPPAPGAAEPRAPVARAATPPARTSSVDQKLDAVLAETRKAAGRLSGSFRRLDAPETTQEIPARELTERRLEEAITAHRADVSGEMSQLRDDVAAARAELSVALAQLRDELAAARRGASNAESAAAAANDRARRLEEALRQAFRDLSD